MSILTASNLTKFYGPDEVFSGVSAEIPHRARIALVGPNGAGKTTLLNIFAGLDIPTEGSVTKAKGLRIGFLPQRPELAGDHVLWDELLSAFNDLREMEAELARLEAAIADQHETALARYGELQEKFELAGGYTYEQRMRRVLHGLSFTPEDYHRPLALLSGGQKTRALLGRLLLEAPDLLLLDEPTNHLDIDAIEWLENYLKEFPGAVLAVSHDRYFMDAVATAVWELDFGALETYRGNYSHYIRQREERHERLLLEYEAQQEFITKQEEYIRRNMAGQNTRQAKGRLRRLERLKRDELILRPRQRRDMYLRMKATVRSGDLVLRTRGLTVGWDAPLFHAPDITLVRGEVAALIGPNGVGKSTFVKTIIEQLPPLTGEVKIGAAVKIGYFAQAHELLNPKNSILDEVFSVKEMGLGEARNYLGLFLFSGDDVFRPVESLSGGERGRVALAKLALAGANFLVLDEPTNHLDIASQELLQNVLADFKGTILLVSHDRYLIDALATQIWALSSGEMNVYNGTYQEYLTAREKQRQSEAESTVAAAAKSAQNGGKTSEKKHGLNPHQLKLRLDEIEATIHVLEAQLQALTADIETASAQGDAGRIRELGEAYTQTEADLHAAMQDWERLVD